MLKRYQPTPQFEEPIKEVEIESQAPTSGKPHTSKLLNSDPDGYVPGKINQTECIARLAAAGLGSNTDAAAYERVLRVALALDSVAPITPEILGDLWLAYMHEPVIDGSNVLSTAVVGYANRNRITLPQPGIGTNGHRCTFQEEMKRRCA